MVDFPEARRRALRYLADMDSENRKAAELRKNLSPREREVLGLGPEEDDVTELALVENETLEEDFGWVFFYQSKKYIDTGNVDYSLIGNAPLIVSKADGAVHETGTAHPVEVYIENFRRFGDPHGQP